MNGKILTIKLLILKIPCNGLIIILIINDVSLDNASLLLMEIVDLLQKLLKNNVSQLEVKLQNRIKALNPKLGYKNQID